MDAVKWAQENQGKLVKVNFSGWEEFRGRVVGYTGSGCICLESQQSMPGEWDQSSHVFKASTLFRAQYPIRAIMRFILDGIELVTAPVAAKPVCECGAVKINSPRHSSWCPVK